MKCPNCNSKVEKIDDYCATCGFNLKGENSKEIQSKKIKNMFFGALKTIFVVGGGMILICSVIIALLFGVCVFTMITYR